MVIIVRFNIFQKIFIKMNLLLFKAFMKKAIKLIEFLLKTVLFDPIILSLPLKGFSDDL